MGNPAARDQQKNRALLVFWNRRSGGRHGNARAVDFAVQREQEHMLEEGVFLKTQDVEFRISPDFQGLSALAQVSRSERSGKSPSALSVKIRLCHCTLSDAPQERLTQKLLFLKRECIQPMVHANAV